VEGFALTESTTLPPSSYVASPARPGPEPVPPTRPLVSAVKKKRRNAVRPWENPKVRGALVGVLVLVLVLAAIALFVPGGKRMVGLTLVVAGGLTFLAGYLAGAYGAFSEDFLFGFLYLAVPFYTAYYIVTRGEDLWRWFIAMIVGTLILLTGVSLVSSSDDDSKDRSNRHEVTISAALSVAF
jgi:hypothetical protein